MKLVWKIVAASVLLWACAPAEPARPDAQAEGPRQTPTPNPQDVPPLPAGAPSDVVTPEIAAKQSPTFETYWYRGAAELSRYKLDQQRYGEVHPGEAVLVFVSEDFLRDKQVKYEHGPRDQATPILKLNAYRRFYTGVYPYTMMTSVFDPVANPAEPPLKLSASSQEWCGATWTQLNHRGQQWQARSFSYFQDEADTDEAIPNALVEDGVWTQLRRDPSSLPQGELQMIPALHYLRLAHQELKAYPATATVDRVERGAWGQTPAKVWRVAYPDLRRELAVYYEERFPYGVLAWEETYPGGFSPDTPLLTTRGVRTSAILLDYWSRHNLADGVWREVLGLEY